MEERPNAVPSHLQIERARQSHWQRLATSVDLALCRDDISFGLRRWRKFRFPAKQRTAGRELAVHDGQSVRPELCGSARLWIAALDIDAALHGRFPASIQQYRDWPAELRGGAAAVLRNPNGLQQRVRPPNRINRWPERVLHGIRWRTDFCFDGKCQCRWLNYGGHIYLDRWKRLWHSAERTEMAGVAGTFTHRTNSGFSAQREQRRSS